MIAALIALLIFASGFAERGHIGLHVSVDVVSGGHLGLNPEVRVVGKVDYVFNTGPGSSQTTCGRGDLPIAPMATSKKKPNISLYAQVRARQNLLRAWRTIRANAEMSGNVETRLAARAFEENLINNIDKIQRKLRSGTFSFAEARGVVARKSGSKKGKRAIVVAPIEDRVVQRAILDTIYNHCDVPEVSAVLAIKTSVGGVPRLGIGHALSLIEQAVENGAQFAIKSDIHNFFPSIPRAQVSTFLNRYIPDIEFVRLFEDALTVELVNRDALGADIDLFPVDEQGIAQGSPLSVLAGNIILNEFDKAMNARGVVCIRYIDDFLILARDKSSANKALTAGLKILSELGLHAYQPSDGSDKAWAGSAHHSYDFLGYKIVRGLNPPSEKSCRKLLERIDEEIAEGKKWISRCVESDEADPRSRQLYIQTFMQIDSILRGWAGAFKYTQSIQSFKALDKKIDDKLLNFERWFAHKISRLPTHFQRRAKGIRLLMDTVPSPLPKID